MEEMWKDVVGYEGIYEVSSIGNVRKKETFAKVCGNGYRKVKSHNCKTYKFPNGYIGVKLYINHSVKNKLVHRLVAEAFIDNPENYPQVNHKDENIENNCMENLEWCTSKYNANYGTRNERCRKGNSRFFKKVAQIDKESGDIIKIWDCIGDASRILNINDSHIIRVCKHLKRNVTAGGFIWKYADEL